MINENLTELPKKWRIKISEWLIPHLKVFLLNNKSNYSGYKNTWGNPEIGYIFYSHGDTFYQTTTNYDDSVAQEISETQFKKWVLKEAVIIPLEYPVNKEYVKLTVIKHIKPNNGDSRISDGTGFPEKGLPIGYKTWAYSTQTGTVHPEGNRWFINIPFDYFRVDELISGKSAEIISSKQQSIESIQEECKRRFPIGCRFKNTAGDIYILSKDNYTYQVCNERNVWAGHNQGCLYQDGIYAEVISLPKVEENKSEDFKAGDWVIFNNEIGAKNNPDLVTLGKAYLLLKVDIEGWLVHKCDNGKEDGFKKHYYRLALPHEIPSNHIPLYVECVNSWHPDWITGKIYKVSPIQHCFPEKLSVIGYNNVVVNVFNWQLPNSDNSGFKPSTEEAYLKQQNQTFQSNILLIQSNGEVPKTEPLLNIISTSPTPPLLTEWQILVTEENQDEIKRIAQRAGIRNGYGFSCIGDYYKYKDGMFIKHATEAFNCDIIPFEDFKIKFTKSVGIDIPTGLDKSLQQKPTTQQSIKTQFKQKADINVIDTSVKKVKTITTKLKQKPKTIKF